VTVLVVEDDPDVRDLVVLSLKHAGYEVLAQSNGQSALAVALGEQPDLVILDWMMPGMTGVEVCRALRADPRGQHVGVLLLTSRAQERDIDLGFDAGANDYMVKPFRGRELISRVDSLVRASRQRASRPGYGALLT
jgi:DNA-binding response OmpR family regulator